MRGDIARNEPLCYIPSKCIITTEHARVSPIGHLFESHETLFVTNYDRDHYILMIYVMYEKMKGGDSFYHPYFDMVDPPLPTIYWPAEVLE